MVRKRSTTMCESSASKLITSSSSSDDDDSSDNDLSDIKATTLTDAWTLEESKLLLHFVRQQIPENDKHAYYHTISKLNWSEASNAIYKNPKQKPGAVWSFVLFLCLYSVQIANELTNKSAEMCKTQLTKLLKDVRHTRILNELLVDVEEKWTNGTVKSKTTRLSGYNLFCREFRLKRPDIKGKVRHPPEKYWICIYFWNVR